MNKSLTGIGFNHKLSPHPNLLHKISKQTFIINFSVDSYPHLNTGKLAVLEVLMLHENKELIPYGDSYDLYLGNNYPTGGIILELVVIPVRN